MGRQGILPYYLQYIFISLFLSEQKYKNTQVIHDKPLKAALVAGSSRPDRVLLIRAVLLTASLLKTLL